MAAILRGLSVFISDMRTLRRPVAVWASLFPFPQLIVGGFLGVTRGLRSPASVIFAARALSFVVAGQLFLLPRWRMTKITAPIMHLPFLVAIPFAYHWLGTPAAQGDLNMARFVLYTGAVSSLSLLLDARTAYQWLCGRDPGRYVRGNGERQDHLLPLPSLALACYFGLCPSPALDWAVLPLPALAEAGFFAWANPARGAYELLLPLPALATMVWGLLRSG